MQVDGRGRPRRQAQKDRKIEAAKGFLATNPDATNAEVSLATGVSDRTVTSARAQLLAAGILKPGMRGRPPSPEPRMPAREGLAIGIEELEQQGREQLAALTAGEPLTRDQRRIRYSDLARDPRTPVAAQIAAMRALEDMEAASETTKMGPPDPQSEEEAIHRVGLMIEALLDFYSLTAVNRAYEQGTGHSVPVDVGIIHVPMYVSSSTITIPKGTDAPTPTSESQGPDGPGPDRGTDQLTIPFEPGPAEP